MGHRTIGVLVLGMGLALGCAADGAGGERAGRTDGASDGAFDNAIAPSGAAGAGGFGNSVGTQTTPLPSTMGSANDCGGVTYEGEVKNRLDIFVSFDMSGSMFIPSGGGATTAAGGGCYWPGQPGCTGVAPATPGPSAVGTIYASVSEAVRGFVTAPESAGIGVAIRGYSEECDVNSMATPEVAMAPLPENAAPVQAWLDAGGLSPTYGGTETVPAMQGAVQFMRQWSLDHPDSKSVILLVTDGEPDNGCAGDDVAAVAADGLAGAPSIPTYVLGLGNIASLNSVAQAGGTGQAFIVSDPAASGAAVVEQLNAIRGDARPLPCEFLIPAGGELTPDLVNLDFTPADGSATMTVPRVSGPGACGTSGGWHYDDPGAPSTLVACEATCGMLAGGGGRVDIALGCPTVVVE